MNPQEIVGGGYKPLGLGGWGGVLDLSGRTIKNIVFLIP